MQRARVTSAHGCACKCVFSAVTVQFLCVKLKLTSLLLFILAHSSDQFHTKHKLISLDTILQLVISTA